jgi:hypothetical protein
MTQHGPTHLQRLPNAIELPQLTPRLGLFATLLDAWLFIVFAAFQLSLDTVYLQFFLQLPNGEFEVPSHVNFYHVYLRSRLLDDMAIVSS